MSYLPPSLIRDLVSLILLLIFETAQKVKIKVAALNPFPEGFLFKPYLP